MLMSVRNPGGPTPVGPTPDKPPTPAVGLGERGCHGTTGTALRAHVPVSGAPAERPCCWPGRHWSGCCCSLPNYLLPLNKPEDIGVLLLFGGLILIGVVVTWQVRAILNAPFPRLRGFQTLISGIPLLLVVFAAVYYLTGQAQPDGFSEPMDKIGAMYFTVTVFSTVGFGDITAKTDLARTLVTIQMLFNLVVIGLVAQVIFGAVDIGLKNAQPTTTNHPRSQNSPNRQPAGVLSDQEMITGTSCGSMRRELPGTSAANTAAPRDPRGSAGRGDVAVDRDDDRCPDVIVVEQHGGVAGDVIVVPPPAVPVADTDAIARGRAVGRRDAVDDGVSARLLGCGFEDALACERRFAPLRHVVECGDDFSGGEDRRGAPVRRDDRLARWLVLVADPVEMWSAMSAVPVGKVVCVIAERGRRSALRTRRRWAGR